MHQYESNNQSAVSPFMPAEWDSPLPIKDQPNGGGGLSSIPEFKGKPTFKLGQIKRITNPILPPASFSNNASTQGNSHFVMS